MRIVLNAPNPLAEWDQLHGGVASVLLGVEAYRTLDRLWRTAELTQTEFEEKRSLVQTFLPRLELVPIDETVLEAASHSYPNILGTLDAIHLATALGLRAKWPTTERPLLFATHDRSLAAAARAMHFDVLGVAA